MKRTSTTKSMLIGLIIGVAIIGSVYAINLPQNWDRLTCKIYTEDSMGTGFLLRYKGMIYVVTNKHVVMPGKSQIEIRLKKIFYKEMGLYDSTAVSSDSLINPIKMIPPKSFYCIDSIYDLAFIKLVNFAGLLDIAAVPASLIGDDSLIIPGRHVFFLGYPNRMAGYNITVPLVRQGLIAGELQHKIILDGNVFGGSSGSPIFLDPYIDDQSYLPYLIGIIAEQRTIPLKMLPVLEENMGVGIGIKINYILKALDKISESVPRKIQ